MMAAALAVLGGVFFGLFSCGGYIWHRHLFWALLGISLALSAALPHRLLAPIVRRVGFAGGVILAFFLVRAVASAFYPSAPSSWADFARAFWTGLIDGPC